MKRLFLISTLALLLSDFAFATKMVRDKHGNLVVQNQQILKTIKCGNRNVHLLADESNSLSSSLILEISYTNFEKVSEINFSETINEFLSPEYSLSKLKVECFAGKTYVGLYVPHKFESSRNRYLMLLDDGRVLDGYNLTGHAIK